MNIFFKHEETRPSHSSLIDDLAFCGHNERISKLEEYKNQPAITEEWLSKYLKRKYPNNVQGGVLGIKGKIIPTINDYYKLLKETKS